MTTGKEARALRNQEIVNFVETNGTKAAVEKYGLTKERIRQIFTAVTGKGSKETSFRKNTYAHECKSCGGTITGSQQRYCSDQCKHDANVTRKMSKASTDVGAKIYASWLNGKTFAELATEFFPEKAKAAGTAACNSILLRYARIMGIEPEVRAEGKKRTADSMRARMLTDLNPKRKK